MEGNLLSASANVLLSAGMFFTLMLYGVMLSNNLNSLLFVSSAKSLFFYVHECFVVSEAFNYVFCPVYIEVIFL